LVSGWIKKAIKTVCGFILVGAIARAVCGEPLGELSNPVIINHIPHMLLKYHPPPLSPPQGGG